MPTRLPHASPSTGAARRFLAEPDPGLKAHCRPASCPTFCAEGSSQAKAGSVPAAARSLCRVGRVPEWGRRKLVVVALSTFGVPWPGLQSTPAHERCSSPQPPSGPLLLPVPWLLLFPGLGAASCREPLSCWPHIGSPCRHQAPAFCRPHPAPPLLSLWCKTVAPLGHLGQGPALPPPCAWRCHLSRWPTGRAAAGSALGGVRVGSQEGGKRRATVGGTGAGAGAAPPQCLLPMPPSRLGSALSSSRAVTRALASLWPSTCTRRASSSMPAAC